MVDGFSDVYVYGFESGKVSNVTGNIFENNYVSWSPDGQSLVFTEEREECKRIAICGLSTGVKKFLTKPAAHDYAYPRFSGANEIIYTSDKTGIWNLYKMDAAKGAETQLTNVINGVFCPSVSGEYLAYSYYEDACHNIYKYMRSRPAEFERIPLVYMEGLLKEDKKKPENKGKIQATAIDPAKYRGNDDESYRKSVEEKAKALIKSNTAYSTTFTPDLILGILGFSSDSGFVGGGYFTLSDMLGNHNFSLYANYVPGYYAQFDFTYLYMSLPFDVGMRVFYNQDIYQLYDTETAEFFSKLDSSQVGGSLSLKYPFSTYTSLGFDIGSSRTTDKYTNYATSNAFIFPETSENILNTIDIYLSYDYSAWRDMWPYSGDYFLAYMEAADRVFGGTRVYTMYELDYRKYFDLSFVSSRNMSLSFRALLALIDGPDRPYFLFGGMNTLRGLVYGEYTGDKIALFNAELRYTLARNINFKLWPMDFLMIKNLKVALFNDAGYVNKGEVKRVTNEEIKNGLGLSVVVDTFILQRQYTPLKFEVAKRTDNGDDTWRFYFSIATGY